MQLKPVNHGQNDFLALLPLLNVTTKPFGGLLSQQTWYKRETRDYSSLSRACFHPSPSESAASQTIKASGERAQGDPSSCETTPAREAARPRCHKPVSAAPRAQLPGLGIAPLPGLLRGTLHSGKRRKAAVYRWCDMLC